MKKTSRGAQIVSVLALALTVVLGSIGTVSATASDGTLDTTFNNGGTGAAGAGAKVWSTLTQPDGKILVMGGLTSYNGSPVGHITRLNTDGTIDANFNPGGAGADNFVGTATLLSDGKILIGGDFTSYNGTTGIGRIARLNADGTLDTTFNNGGTGANGQITSVALLSDGKILIGGSFTSYNGTTGINGITRLNTNGTRDTTFNPGGAGAVTADIREVIVQPDGKIVIGGYFTSYNGNTGINRIARLNADGTPDTTFNNGGTGLAPTGVQAMARQADGKILIGGLFTSYNGTPVECPARLNVDGTPDTTFNNGGTGVQSGYTPYTLAVQPDGTIMIGGTFSSYNGTTVGNIARLNNAPTGGGGSGGGSGGGGSNSLADTGSSAGSMLPFGAFAAFGMIAGTALLLRRHARQLSFHQRDY